MEADKSVASPWENHEITTTYLHQMMEYERHKKDHMREFKMYLKRLDSYTRAMQDYEFRLETMADREPPRHKKYREEIKEYDLQMQEYRDKKRWDPPFRPNPPPDFSIYRTPLIPYSAPIPPLKPKPFAEKPPTMEDVAKSFLK